MKISESGAFGSADATSESPIPTTVEAYNARELRTAINDVADRLERLAKEIRRYGDDVDRVGESGRATYGQITGSITHEIMTTLALLNLNSLSRHATGADIARAEGGQS